MTEPELWLRVRIDQETQLNDLDTVCALAGGISRRAAINAVWPDIIDAIREQFRIND